MKHTTRLLEIMAQLRNPNGGCPWDVEQDFASIASHTIEEAYEVVDAIKKQDMAALREELGDLLLQVVFHAQMAKEQELFDFEAVAESICDKLIRRHPHVFGDADIKTAEAQTEAWEAIKAQERAAKGKPAAPASILDDIPHALPALLRAQKLQKRAGKVGFDWNDVGAVIEKLHEELDEVADASTPEDVHEEIGDLLFVCVNLARHRSVDAETALRDANAKFERRFHYIERELAKRGTTPAESTLEEMDALWNEARAKDKEKAA